MRQQRSANPDVSYIKIIPAGPTLGPLSLTATHRSPMTETPPPSDYLPTMNTHYFQGGRRTGTV